MDIIGKRNWYFLISLLVLIPGIISLFVFGLNLSIDFTGGSRITFSLPKVASSVEIDKIRSAFEEENIKVSTIEKSSNLVFVRTQPIDQVQDTKVINKLNSEIKNFKQEEFETIGPTIGAETTSNAVKAVIIASFLIVLYITLSFRKVPKPASSFRFGVCAIIALVHDTLVVVGAFAIFGYFFGVEIDSLFVTAILTVIGFSVHDTIVVFDRIRENLKRMGATSFPQVVNDSILQTVDRSLNTSLTVILVLLAMLLFGGASIKWFVVALLVGITTGTYSSIFIAAAFLVVWQNWSQKRKALK
ncbi:MAG TPA: protein translocase subunit SecF [Patescibacteria group bacterium]|nr:protein translocase subunit SecF [Patescibacteria group bacterium]